MKLRVGENGPFALCADPVNRKIYLLDYDKDAVQRDIDAKIGVLILITGTFAV